MLWARGVLALRYLKPSLHAQTHTQYTQASATKLTSYCTALDSSCMRAQLLTLHMHACVQSCTHTYMHTLRTLSLGHVQREHSRTPVRPHTCTAHVLTCSDPRSPWCPLVGVRGAEVPQSLWSWRPQLGAAAPYPPRSASQTKE